MGTRCSILLHDVRNLYVVFCFILFSCIIMFVGFIVASVITGVPILLLLEPLHDFRTMLGARSSSGLNYSRCSWVLQSCGRMGQTNTSFIVCSPPHSHAVCPSSLYPHFCIRALHRPVPVRRRFRLDQVETRRAGFTGAALSSQDYYRASCDSMMAASFDVTWINCSEESPVPLWRHLHSGCRSKLGSHGKCRQMSNRPTSQIHYIEVHRVCHWTRQFRSSGSTVRLLPHQ